MESCFVPLLRWILSLWQGTQLALAIDATTLGQLFTVLTISVVYRGCAIPVGWKVLAATEKHSWKWEWMRMLHQLRPAIPASYTVIVLADRGLYARWLYRRIVRLGWHPFLRINANNFFRPTGNPCYHPLSYFTPKTGTRWSGTGTCFKGNETRLDCTLLACWEEGYKEAWYILTDLPPEASDACWYGMRTWIEQGYKITKRGGWQWQRTRMTDPDRASRLWLAVAVARLRRAVERGGRGRSGDTGEHLARCDGHPGGTSAAAQGHAPATGECIPTGLGTYSGRLAQWSTVVSRGLCPRPMADAHPRHCLEQTNDHTYAQCFTLINLPLKGLGVGVR